MRTFHSEAVSMPISQAIAEFTGALDAARAELAEVNAKIAALEAERQRVANAQPHTDDIVAVFMRGLQSTAGDFERQFALRLSSTFVGDGSAAAAGIQRSLNILRLEAQAPDQQTALTRSLKGNPPPDLNVAVLAYFLRDQIAAEIPMLGRKLINGVAV